MKPKTFLISAIVFLVVGIVAVASMFAFSANKNSGVADVTSTPAIIFGNTASRLTGYIYSSGLTTGYQYQLTYINYNKSVIAPTEIEPILDGVFLSGQESLVASYWGKCVDIIGTMPPELNTVGISENYFRANMVVSSVQPSTDCSVSLDNYTDASSSSGTYSGIIARIDRPTPDIAYDYKLFLTTPYKSTDNASGQEEMVTSIIVVPMTTDVFSKFETGLGKTVTVNGQWMTGFAESSFFLVNSIN